MAVTIEGATIVRMAMEISENGERKIVGTYHLMSNAGKVLAKQDFGGYGAVATPWSPQTLEAMKNFFVSAQADLNTTLGL